MNYDVHLTFEGDPALAAQWAGFAKKKAREFGEFCERHGQAFGTKWYDITPDVRIKVRYASGIQKAHIIAVANSLHGVATDFTAASYLGWGEPFTPENSPLGTQQTAFVSAPHQDRIVDIKGTVHHSRFGNRTGDQGVLSYGRWVCQIPSEQNSGAPITMLGEPKGENIHGRYFGLGGLNLDSPSRVVFAMNGKGYSSGFVYMLGAFIYNKRVYAVGSTSLASDVLGTATKKFPAGAMGYVKDLGSVKSIQRDRPLHVGPYLTSFSLSNVTISHAHPGCLTASPDGKKAVISFGTNASEAYANWFGSPKVMYITMSTDEDGVVSATASAMFTQTCIKGRIQYNESSSVNIINPPDVGDSLVITETTYTVSASVTAEGYCPMGFDWWLDQDTGEYIPITASLQADPLSDGSGTYVEYLYEDTSGATPNYREHTYNLSYHPKTLVKILADRSMSGAFTELISTVSNLYCTGGDQSGLVSIAGSIRYDEPVGGGTWTAVVTDWVTSDVTEDSIFPVDLSRGLFLRYRTVTPRDTSLGDIASGASSTNVSHTSQPGVCYEDLLRVDYLTGAVTTYALRNFAVTAMVACTVYIRTDDPIEQSFLVQAGRENQVARPYPHGPQATGSYRDVHVMAPDDTTRKKLVNFQESSSGGTGVYIPSEAVRAMSVAVPTYVDEVFSTYTIERFETLVDLVSVTSNGAKANNLGVV